MYWHPDTKPKVRSLPRSSVMTHITYSTAVNIQVVFFFCLLLGQDFEKTGKVINGNGWFGAGCA